MSDRAVPGQAKGDGPSGGGVDRHQVTVGEDVITVALTDGYFRGNGNRDIEVSAREITICSLSGNFLECLIDCEGGVRDLSRLLREHGRRIGRRLVEHRAVSGERAAGGV